MITRIILFLFFLLMIGSVALGCYPFIYATQMIMERS